MRWLAVLLICAVPACGLSPVYSSGGRGAVAQTLAQISVADIAGKPGWLVRNNLLDRLGRADMSGRRYRLEVELDDQISGLGLRSDNAVTRERRTLRARYRLVDTQTNRLLFDATARSDAGVDVVASEYATIAAEQTALELLAEDVAGQIIARLALFARGNPALAPDTSRL
jgi:LPS-assembly lipoprotein